MSRQGRGGPERQTTSLRVRSWRARGTASLILEHWTSLGMTPWAWSHMGVVSHGHGLPWAWSYWVCYLVGVTFHGCGRLGVAPVGVVSRGRGPARPPRPLFPERISGWVPCGRPFPAHREDRQRTGG